MKSKARVPAIGQPARGSRTRRPIMVAPGLLGRPRTLRILWELRSGAPMTFRALEEAAQTNPSLLNTRLRELRATDLVSHEGEGYLLTPTGLELLEALTPFAAWAGKWGKALEKGLE